MRIDQTNNQQSSEQSKPSIAKIAIAIILGLSAVAMMLNYYQTAGGQTSKVAEAEKRAAELQKAAGAPKVMDDPKEKPPEGKNRAPMSIDGK